MEQLPVKETKVEAASCLLVTMDLLLALVVAGSHDGIGSKSIAVRLWSQKCQKLSD